MLRCSGKVFFKFGMQQVYYIQAPPSKIWLGMKCPITDKDWIEVEQVTAHMELAQHNYCFHNFFNPVTGYSEIRNLFLIFFIILTIYRLTRWVQDLHRIYYI